MAIGVRLPELNLALLGGRLTRDPELFFTPGGGRPVQFHGSRQSPLEGRQN